MTGRELLAAYLAHHNEGVRTGDWQPLLDSFSPGAELDFEDARIEPFVGVDAIGRAYRERPPDDEVLVLDAEEHGDRLVVARYAWAADPERPAGELRLTRAGDRISRLVVTFGE